MHERKKVELFAPLPLLEELGFDEGQRFATSWGVEFLTATLYPVSSTGRGRKFERRRAKRNGPLVGQARLRLMDPTIPTSETPRFQPIKKVPCWLGKVGKDLVLEFGHPLQQASAKAVRSYTRRTKLAAHSGRS